MYALACVGVPVCRELLYLGGGRRRGKEEEEEEG